MMRKTSFLILVMALSFFMFKPIFVYKFGWSDLPTQTKDTLISELLDPLKTKEAQAAETVLLKLQKRFNAPSISIAISQGRELTWRGAIGYSNLDKNTRITFSDRFRLGSTSKAITAGAAAILIDKDLLNYDTPMSQIDDSLSSELHTITVGQALSHRAGIRNYGVCLCFPIWEHLNAKKYDSIRKSIEVIEDSKLLYSPGETYHYTSLGFNLGGLALEKAAGIKFDDLLEKEVFRPLGMKGAQLEINLDDTDSIAIPYDVEGKTYKPAIFVNNSIRWPSGGIIASPSDMVKYGVAILHDDLMSEKVKNKMLTVPNSKVETGGEDYAMGWRVGEWKIDEDNTLLAYHHNGVAVGSQSVFLLLPEKGMAISAMMNKSSTNIGELAELVNSIASVFLNTGNAQETGIDI